MTIAMAAPDPVADYIRAQPAVVGATLAAARAALAEWSPTGRGVVLVGSG